MTRFFSLLENYIYQPLGAKDLVDVAQADLRLAQHVVGQHIATGVLHIDAAPLQTKVGQSSC